MTMRSALLVALFVIVCPACGRSPDMGAPETAADEAVRAVDTDAPSGVCRPGARAIPHVGCVDEQMSFSVDAVNACRSDGETECSSRCQSGDAPSCTALALVHAFALEASANTTYAARLLDRACAAGDGAACNDLAVFHAKGLGFPVSVEKAEALFGVACDHGDVHGCANLASARTWGDTPPVPVARALETVSRACQSTSDANACAAMGVLKARGSSGPQDEQAAAALFTKACDGGEVGSCERLGRAYRDGDGVKPDDVAALKLFRRACDQGAGEACTDLATMYCLGRGIPRDPERSSALMQQSCRAGDAAACRAKACNATSPL